MEEFDFIEGWKTLPPPDSAWSPVEATEVLACVPHPSEQFVRTQGFLDGLVESRGICPMIAHSVYGEWYRSVADGTRVVTGTPIDDFIDHVLQLGAKVDEHLKALEVKREAEAPVDRALL